MKIDLPAEYYKQQNYSQGLEEPFEPLKISLL